MPVQRSIALAVFHPAHPGKVLVVKRPPWDADLPDIWGLPAVSMLPGESLETAVRRCAITKLGRMVHAQGVLGEGWQEGPSGAHKLTLWACGTEEDTFSLPPPRPEGGSTLYTAWKWAPPSLLAEGARRGSLCCRLFLAWDAGSTLLQNRRPSL
ncbi:hypothetical protein HRbin23_00931 [bacterium HR23]|nr:hypothetical protein HRbin23_00931 [bacterium HR23]